MKGFVADTRFRWALMALAAILPSFAVVSSKGIVVLLALCALAVAVTRPRLPGKEERILLLPGLLAAWAIVSLPWAFDPNVGRTIVRLVMVFGLALVLYLEVTHLDARRREAVLRYASWGCMAALVLLVIGAGLAQMASDRDGYHYWLNKIKPASTVVAIILWPAAISVWRRHSFGWAMLLVGLGAAVLWIGDAKAAKVAFVVALPVFLAALMWRKALALVMAALVGASVLFSPLLALQPLKYPAFMEYVPNSGVHRLHIWDFVAQRIAERPIMGWGYNSSRIIPGGKTLVHGGEAIPLHPHNAPLQIWLELGLVGAILAALTLVATALAAGRWERQAAAGALAAFASAWAVGTLSYGIWQQWWVCVLIFALVLCRALPEAPKSARIP